MLWHGKNLNILLFELPITDFEGESLKVLAMISLEERVRKTMEKVHYVYDPKFSLDWE